MRRRGVGQTLAAVLAVAFPVGAWAQPAVDDPCAVPASVLSADADLPRAAERLKAGEPLSILIVNSAKPHPKPGAISYPARLSDELTRRLPGRKVETTVLSLPGRVAPEMVGPLAQAVERMRPALVVWQTGTADAMRNLDPESFGTALDEGIAAAQRRGADVIVMDMQYSMHTAQLIDFAPYVTYMAWAGQRADVFHFPRYDIMRHWVEDGRVDFADETDSAKQRAYDFVHRCVAQLMADSVATMLDRRNGASH
ncbi:hypothetical protein [Azospirillum sp. TSO35-2]|uniref:hypothetical protein n=1 Tax=Azospirillum sp. TSO35-2 TaxID=716796 RepID=UPI000D61E9E5|nr:hypothetical protein [Azospirillum sp. TSO35-2]PWC33179.1 hypothetical protein TSO352_21865 [Azospirillum sp. TSO35-2]